MAQNKKNITPDNIIEWLGSTGFLFPRDNVELERFNKLYEDSEEEIKGDEINPDKIINESASKKIILLGKANDENPYPEFRMVARKGSNIPNHILKKMKQNQDNSKLNDSDSTTEKD